MSVKKSNKESKLNYENSHAIQYEVIYTEGHTYNKIYSKMGWESLEHTAINDLDLRLVDLNLIWTWLLGGLDTRPVSVQQ